MKPLPSQDSTTETKHDMPFLSLNANPGSYSIANRRVNSGPLQRAYPWLLFASTAVAAAFCFAYFNKSAVSPVSTTPIVSEKNDTLTNPATLPLGSEKIIPNGNTSPAGPSDDSLPPVSGPIPDSVLATEYEETNIRIQHVLEAESPTGDISRIVIDVPVLYRSGNLRLTRMQAEEARVILDKLELYQKNVSSLRTEGIALCTAWDSLIAESLPVGALSSDSPSLPKNQRNLPSPESTSGTTESIKIPPNSPK